MTRRKIYIVRLENEEKDFLIQMTKSGKSSARKITRAKVLLKADENGPGWLDKKIAEALDISTATIERCRKRFVEEGLMAAIGRKKRKEKKLRKKLNGEAEAKLVALVCSDPPEGYSRWSLRLLASRLVKLEVIDEISYETVRRTLKKMSLSLG